MKRSSRQSEDCSLAVLLQPSHMSPNQIQLIEAARKNNLDELEKLVESRVDVNARNNLDRTALHWAAANGHSTVIQILIHASANVNAADKYGMTPLLLSAWFGHLDAFETLLKCKKLDVQCTDKQGMNVLHCAVVNNYVNIVETMKESPLFEKFDFNSKEQHDKTSLHLAAERSFEGMVDYLLSIECNPSILDDTGKTSLHLAASGGFLHIVQSLIQHQSDVNLPDKEGMTALHLANSSGHVSVVEKLLVSGADVNSKTKKQMTSLMLAAISGHFDCVAELMKNSTCELNEQNEECNTALHLSCENNHLNLVRLLISKGCDVNIVNQMQQTALHIATEKGNAGIILLLLNARSDLSLKDNMCKTPLALAARANFAAVVDLIIKFERLRRHFEDYSEQEDKEADRENKELKERTDEAFDSRTRPNEADETRDVTTDGDDSYAEDCRDLNKASSTLEVTKLEIHETEDTTADQRSDSDVFPITACRNTGFVPDDSMADEESSKQLRESGEDETKTKKKMMSESSDSEEFLATSSTVGDVDHDSSMTQQLEENSECLVTMATERCLQESPLPDDFDSLSQRLNSTLEPVTPSESNHAMKELLWKLSRKKMKEGEWKKLARHWKFTEEEIHAVEQQYTGANSYKDHTYRVFIIWLDCYLEENTTNVNPLRGLYDALVAIDRKKLAEHVRNKCNKQSEDRKSCRIS